MREAERKVRRSWDQGRIVRERQCCWLERWSKGLLWTIHSYLEYGCRAFPGRPWRGGCFQPPLCRVLTAAHHSWRTAVNIVSQRAWLQFSRNKNPTSVSISRSCAGVFLWQSLLKNPAARGLVNAVPSVLAPGTQGETLEEKMVLLGQEMSWYIWSTTVSWLLPGLSESPGGEGASLVAQMVKNLPEMRGIQGWSLGQKDALEKGVAAHSSILAWRIPWTEEPGGLLWGRKESDRTEWLTLSLSAGEGLKLKPILLIFACLFFVGHWDWFRYCGITSQHLTNASSPHLPSIVSS